GSGTSGYQRVPAGYRQGTRTRSVEGVAAGLPRPVRRIPAIRRHCTGNPGFRHREKSLDLEALPCLLVEPLDQRLSFLRWRSVARRPDDRPALPVEERSLSVPTLGLPSVALAPVGLAGRQRKVCDPSLCRAAIAAAPLGDFRRPLMLDASGCRRVPRTGIRLHGQLSGPFPGTQQIGKEQHAREHCRQRKGHRVEHGFRSGYTIAGDGLARSSGPAPKVVGRQAGRRIKLF
ncbi:MAG: hypothetical protein RIS35_358, partial [Pseudomonadota bacterium]